VAGGAGGHLEVTGEGTFGRAGRRADPKAQFQRKNPWGRGRSIKGLRRERRNVGIKDFIFVGSDEAIHGSLRQTSKW
jgi:hypothetical protein